MRSLYNAQRRRGRFVRCNRSIKVDLSWWLKFVDEFNGVSMMLDSHWSDASSLGLFTDASLEGFGACYVMPDGTAEYFGGCLWSDIMPGIDTSQETGKWHSEL